MVTKRNSRFSKRPKLLAVSICSVAAAMIFAVAAKQPSVGALADANLGYGGKFYTEFTNQVDAFNAAHEHAGKIVAEGAVLFKNDGSLPLDPRTNAVTVLGVRSGNLVEAVDGTLVAPQSVDPMATGLRNAGFKVNPVMEEFYQRLPDDQKLEQKETVEFTEPVMRSLERYGDVAVIVIQRAIAKEDRAPQIVTTGKTSAANKVNGVEQLTGHEDHDNGMCGIRELQDKAQGADPTAPYGWDHAHPGWSPKEDADAEAIAAGKVNVHKDAENNEYVEVKHGLQLTSTEQELIEFAKSHFKKVVFTLNSSHTFEFYNLEHDKGINGILWFGRPGQHSAGITAVGKILAGQINPSGGAPYEYERDFTADPTYMNNSTGRQFRYGSYAENVPGDIVGRYPNSDNPEDCYLTGIPATQLSGVRFMDYEEDIYFGYKYYETFTNEIREGHTSLIADTAPLADREAAAEAWHNYNVVYPFGFGLSYTSWEFALKGVFTDEKATQAFTDPTKLAEGADQVKTLYVKVNVANTGAMEGKKTVQVYVTAPYTAGGVEKAYVKLVGFAKTGYVKPNSSQDVIVEIDVQDLASFDATDKDDDSHKGYELDSGKYVLKAMGCSSELRSKAVGEYAEGAMTLATQVNLDHDTFTGAEIVPLFSDPTQVDYMLRPADGSWSKKVGTGSVLFSREDMEATFPKPLTYDDLIMNEAAITKNLKTYNMGTENNLNNFFGEEYGSVDKDAKWNKEGKIPANWTQAADNKGEVTLKLKDMAGVPFEDAKWDTFMNQMTYQEMSSLFTSGQPAIDRFGKMKDANADRPLNLGGAFTWPDAPLQAATFNVELIERMGELVAEMALLKGKVTTGWWGPGTNTNRGHFDGRCKEYYSQDAVHGGRMGAAASIGSQSRGVTVYIKHYTLHNEEDPGCSLHYFISEQDFRENFLPAFRRVFQQGHCMAAMVNAQKEGCWLQGTHNFDFLDTLTRGEWGFKGEYVSDHFGGQKSPTFIDPRAQAAADKIEDAEAKAAYIARYTWKSPTNKSNNSNNNLDLCLRTTTCPMSSPNYKLNGVWDASLREGKGSVKVWWGEMDGEAKKLVQCDTEYYWMRQMAQHAMYKSANSVLARNGVDVSVLKAQSIAGKEGVAVNAVSPLSGDAINGEQGKFAITAGELPTGVSLNEKTGAITGTPNQSGKFSVTISVVVANWIKGSYRVDFDIKSAWVLVLEGLEVGKAVEDASVSREGIPANATNIRYGVDSGKLPAGLVVSTDGEITGTPTEPGEYTFVLNVKYDTQTQGASRPTTTTTTLKSEEFKIVVAGEEAPVVEPIYIVSVTANAAGDGYVIVFSNGQQIELKNGAAGAAGKDGVTPTIAIGENGNWFINGVDTGVKAQGPAGANGQDGAQGPKGDTGAQGPAGPAGADGKDGASASGCGGVIGLTSALIAVITLAGAAIIIRRKED